MPCSQTNHGSLGEGRKSVALGAARHSGHCESKRRTDKANIATVPEVLSGSKAGNNLLGCANHLGSIDSSKSVTLPYIKHCNNDNSVIGRPKSNRADVINSVTHSKSNLDTWQTTHGTHVLHHENTRRNSETPNKIGCPCDVSDLDSMRLTCGTYTNGTFFPS